MENVVRISRLTIEERYWLVFMYYALLHKLCTPGGMQPAEVTHFLSATIIWRKGIIQDFRGTLVPFMFWEIVADKSFGAYSNLLELQLYLRHKLFETNLGFNVANDIDFAIKQQIGILQPCVPILAQRFGLANFDLANQIFLHEQIAVERNLPVPERCLRFVLSFYSSCLEAALLGVGSVEPEIDIIAVPIATYRIAFGIDLRNMCSRTLAFSSLFLVGLILTSLEISQGWIPSPMVFESDV
jgi:hypothetical protein